MKLNLVGVKVAEGKGEILRGKSSEIGDDEKSRDGGCNGDDDDPSMEEP